MEYKVKESAQNIILSSLSSSAWRITITMRLLVLAVAATLAVADVSELLQKNVLRVGKEYSYLYESDVITGIPYTSNAISGIKIKAKVRLQVKPAYEVVLKVEDATIYKIQKEVPSLPLEQSIPEALGERLSYDQEKYLKDNLARPIKFNYERGKVKKIKASADEPAWCLNIKRAILSLLQLNLNERQAIKHSDSYPRDYVSLMRNVVPRKQESSYVYRVWEEDPIAMAESLYNINELRKNEYQVTKVRNYNEVKNMKDHFHGFYDSSLCFECDERRRQMLTTAGHAHYRIKRENNDIVIKKASLRSQQTVKFFGVDKPYDEIITYTYQQFVHQNTQNINQQITVPALKSQEYSMRSDLPAINPQRQPVFQRLSASTLQNIKAKVRAILDLTLPKLEPFVDQKALQEIVELVRLLRNIHKEDLVSICSPYLKVSSVDREKKIRKIFLDILPILGTEEAVLYMKDLIKQKAIVGRQAAHGIQQLQLLNTAQPSPRIMDALLELTKDPVVRNDLLVRHASFLALGGLAHQIHHHRHIPKAVKREMSRKVFNYLDAELKKAITAKNIDEQIVIIKTLGNMGYIPSLPKLAAIFQNREYSTYVRSQAIYALRRLAPLLRYKIQNFLLPIYLNQDVPHDLRIAAFVIVMQTRPGFGVVHLCAQRVRHERSKQVVAFVVSYLRTIRYSQLPCYQKLARHANRVLRMIPTYMPSISYLYYSSALHNDYYSRYLNMGQLFEAFTVYSPHSLIPQSLVARYNVIARGGYNINLIESGLHLEGLHPMLMRLIGPEGVLHRKLSDFKLYDILKPVIDESSRRYKSFFDKIKIDERKDRPFMGSVYLKSMQNEFNYLPFNKKMLESFFETKSFSLDAIELALRQGMPFKFLKSFGNVDSYYTMPTPAGLPVYLNQTILNVLHLHGNVKAEAVPALKDCYAQKRLPDTIKAELLLKVSYNMEAVHAMGINLGNVLIAGVKVSSPFIMNNHMDHKFNLDLKNGKYRQEIKIPQQPLMVFYSNAKPSLYIRERKLPSSGRIYDTKEYELTSKLTYPYKLEKAAVVEDFGVKLTTKVYSTQKRSSVISPSYLNGKQEIQLILQPTSSMPKKVVFEARYRYADKANSYGQAEPLYSSSQADDNDQSRDSSFFSNLWPFSSSSSPTSYSYSAARPDPSITDPIKRELEIIYRTEGDSVKRQTQHLIRVYSSDSTNKYQVDFEGIQKNQNWAQPVKYRVNNIITVPDQKLPFSAQNSLALDSKIYTGDVNNPIKRFTVKAQYDPQRPEEKFYREGKALYQSKIKIIAEQIPEQYKRYMSLAYEYLKSHPCPYLKNYLVARFETNVDNEVTLQTRYYPDTSELDFKIYAPKENHYLLGYPLYLPNYAIPVPNDYPQITGLRGKCEFKDKKVETFDKAEYTVPLLECDNVLAKDCSPDRLFAVLYAKHKTVPNAKILRLITPRNKVELMPDSSRNIIAKVNDQAISFAQNQPYVVYANQNDKSSKVLIKVIRDGPDAKVFARQLGLYIKYKIQDIKVEVSPFYRSRTCGLCGNFNLEDYDEYEGPRRTYIRDPIKYALSYMIPSDQCDVQAIYRQYNYSPNTDVVCEPNDRTIVRERPYRGREEACFSIAPVKRCPSTCAVKSKRRVEIAFSCLPLQDSYTRELINKAGSRVLHELQGRRAQFRQYEDVHDSCSRK